VFYCGPCRQAQAHYARSQLVEHKGLAPSPSPSTAHASHYKHSTTLGSALVGGCSWFTFLLDGVGTKQRKALLRCLMWSSLRATVLKKVQVLVIARRACWFPGERLGRLRPAALGAAAKGGGARSGPEHASPGGLRRGGRSSCRGSTRTLAWLVHFWPKRNDQAVGLRQVPGWRLDQRHRLRRCPTQAVKT
jgi:hypothetical protein